MSLRTIFPLKKNKSLSWDHMKKLMDLNQKALQRISSGGALSVTASLHQSESAEGVQASDWDGSWVSPFGSFPGRDPIPNLELAGGIMSLKVKKILRNVHLLSQL